MKRTALPPRAPSKSDRECNVPRCRTALPINCRSRPGCRGMVQAVLWCIFSRLRNAFLPSGSATYPICAKRREYRSRVVRWKTTSPATCSSCKSAQPRRCRFSRSRLSTISVQAVSLPRHNYPHYKKGRFALHHSLVLILYSWG